MARHTTSPPQLVTQPARPLSLMRAKSGGALRRVLLGHLAPLLLGLAMGGAMVASGAAAHHAATKACAERK